MHTRIAGLSVLITGASGGIGEALAQAFADEGANLVLHSQRRGAELAARIAERGWRERAVIGEADVREPEGLDALLAAGRERFGRVDVAIVNAGIWPSEDLPLDRLDPARVREVIDVNLLGAIWTCRAFMRQLVELGPREDGRGASVCLIGSTAGRFGEANHLEYAVSKAGLHGLMRSLKNEIVRVDPWGRVNLVEPGWTVTPMAAASIEQPGVIERVCASMPLRQLARPEDVAGAVVYLSAPGMARHVSGEVITVAGGMEGRRLWVDAEVDAGAVRRRLQDE
ncbi:SDR family NAD(P)-dependent oxidoreductase [Nannocystaceae bacterium ST9]